jgi:multidrug efflux system outer membrane protein
MSVSKAQFYTVGLSDFLSVPEAEKAMYGSEDELAQSEAAVSISLVALYKALGVGGENDRAICD